MLTAPCAAASQKLRPDACLRDGVDATVSVRCRGASRRRRASERHNVHTQVKWQLKSSMEQSWRQQAKFGMNAEGENDMLREMLLETQPWVLALTFIVSILHTVFEFLAFRNNVSDSASVSEVF